ncbi:oxidoreductase [Aureococcus anophagefferens]|nr:oxidoreductase [Aureococcus anophagefferens]
MLSFNKRQSTPHIDTAEGYDNEAGVGAALAGKPPIYITTKLWPGNPDWGQTPKTYETTVAACKASKEKLGATPDLYLIHGPFSGGPETRLAQWRACVDCKKEGVVKSIGVSNFGVRHLEELEARGARAARGEPAGDPSLLPAAGASGLHETQKHRVHRLLFVDAARELAGGMQSAKADRTEDPVIAAAAAKLGVSQAQVLLRWALQKGYAILPKSTSEARVKANCDLFGFSIDDATMAALDGLNKNEPRAFGKPGSPYDPTAAP